jgi:hypothetical protein
VLKKLLEGSVGLALLAALVGWSNGGNGWVYDRWWDLTTGRKLAEVDRLVQEDKPAEALAALRGHIRRDPTDRRLLYRAAGLYLEMGRPLPALVALAAYYDEAVQDDVERKSARFEAAGAQWEFLLQDGPDELLRWEDKPDGHGKIQVRIKNPNRALLSRAVARWNDDVRIYNAAPREWRKLSKQYSVPGVLGAPVLRTPLTQGLLDPAWAIKSGLVCFNPGKCEETYRAAKAAGSLGAALAAGSVAISAPGDPSCCTISLDDPDLRPMDDVVAEYFAARKVGSAKDIGKTPGSLNELLELNSRLAIKHLFVLDYVYNASRSLQNNSGR